MWSSLFRIKWENLFIYIGYHYDNSDVLYLQILLTTLWPEMWNLVRVSINIHDVNVAPRFTSLTSPVHYHSKYCLQKHTSQEGEGSRPCRLQIFTSPLMSSMSKLRIWLSSSPSCFLDAAGDTWWRCSAPLTHCHSSSGFRFRLKAI